MQRETAASAKTKPRVQVRLASTRGTEQPTESLPAATVALIESSENQRALVTPAVLILLLYVHESTRLLAQRVKVAHG